MLLITKLQLPAILCCMGMLLEPYACVYRLLPQDRVLSACDLPSLQGTAMSVHTLNMPLRPFSNFQGLLLCLSQLFIFMFSQWPFS